jgi:luciferase-like monooxygenase
MRQRKLSNSPDSDVREEKQAINTHQIEFGLHSFGEVSAESSGRLLSDAETVRLMIDEAVLAEAVGIDSHNIGEHYRPEHVDSAGHVILAAIAGRTEHIRLGTSVTVLSTPALLSQAGLGGGPTAVSH